MKLWELIGGGMYRGGMAIVVAPTAEEAITAASAHPTHVQAAECDNALVFRLERVRELPLPVSAEGSSVISYYMHAE